MSLLSDAKATVAKFLVNMGRFDIIMNGDKNTDVTVDNGTIPTLRKLFDYIITNVVGVKILGSVATVADLPTTGNKIGDIWIVTSAGANNAANDGYVWAGSQFRNIGQIRGPIGPAGPVAGSIGLSITRLEIPSLSIPIRSFTVDGFYEIGDLGAGALYVQGRGVLEIQDKDGRYFHLKCIEKHNVGHYGAKGNGVFDDLAAINAAKNAAVSNVIVSFPPPPVKYNISAPIIVGDGSPNGPSTKQNISFIGEGTSGTGGQTGFNNDKGIIISYNGVNTIAAIMQFNGPMVMGLEGIVLEGGYLGYSVTPTATATAGSDTLTNISSMTDVVVGATVFGGVIPADTIVIAVSGNTAKLSDKATGSATGGFRFDHNRSTVDKGLILQHVFRSTVNHVGIKNTRVGLRQDSYGDTNGFVAGSNDSEFSNIWVENGQIAGGLAGTAAFDIGGADATGILDVARNTYSNLVGTVAGDPNATGLALRYCDNLTFRGGMMYSQRPHGLGYAVAIITPTGNGRETAFPAEITFQGVALIGRFYRDPNWKPEGNGNFALTAWPLHSGDMLDPGNPGKGSLPSFGGFTGVDDRGIFFGMTQFRSWLQDSSGNEVAYDTSSIFSRNTDISQVTGTTAPTVFESHRLPAVAMRSRKGKDYPVDATFPLADEKQYSYDRIVKLVMSGNYQNPTGAPANQRLQINLGSDAPVAIFDSGNIPISNNASYGAWHFEGELTLKTSNSLNFNGRLSVSPPGSAGVVASTPVVVLLNNIDNININMKLDQFITGIVVPSANGLIWNCERSSVQVS